MSKNTDPIYCPENILLFETLYGKNLISLGGLEAVDNMFSGFNLRGLKALDLGFGLGGVAFYLAQKYQIEISGIEMFAWMVDYANQHAPSDVAKYLKFTTYDDKELIPFDSENFDIVYSKGVLNHVSNKLPLFKEIYRILKKDGIFIIADWIFPLVELDDSKPLVRETKETYQNVLEKAGFTGIDFRDDSVVFLEYVKSFIKNLKANRKLIETKYDAELYSVILNQHQELLADIANKNRKAVRIVAKR